MTLRILADENMPNVSAWFTNTDVCIERKPGRTLSRKDLVNTDALLVRSVTQVNEDLLHDTPVRFVGSATIGTDHVDQAYLQAQNICFHHAPGCNAQSVADWLLSVFARLHLDHDVPWWRKTIGIVGVGRVGGTVLRCLQRLGCQVILCDPLRHRRGELPEHCALSELLRKADIVCCHTPHTRSGDHPTHALFGAAQLAQLQPGTWLINAGRGPVFQQAPLLQWRSGETMPLVLDVWPDEPTVAASLLNAVALASPHVAGYSLEGKYAGTAMVAQALYRWQQQPIPAAPALPKGPIIDASLSAQADIYQWASDLVLQVYDPARDTVAMRQSLAGDALPPSAFDDLRKSYPTRRQLSSVTVVNAPAELRNWLSKLGFAQQR